MEALDGNAIAGRLPEYFGTEMTVAHGSCAYCGATAQVAELRVYAKATCGNVVIVLVSVRDVQKVHLSGFRLGD